MLRGAQQKGFVMGSQMQADRRRHVRYPLATTVEFFHGPSRRAYPARSADVSAGGMMMFVPVGTPVAPGQPIRLTFGSHDRPEFGRLSERPMDATIVRVDRQRMLSSGHLPVGVRFFQPVS